MEIIKENKDLGGIYIGKNSFEVEDKDGTKKTINCLCIGKDKSRKVITKDDKTIYVPYKTKLNLNKEQLEWFQANLKDLK